MSRKIYMNVADGDECRIAVVEDGRLYEYFVDRPSQLKHLGNIYKAEVNNVESGIQAAFVDLGQDRNGFLHISDTLYAYQNNTDVKDLFSKEIRIVEKDEELLEDTSERDVEEAKLSDDDEVSSDDENGQTDEAEFLDELDADPKGHDVTDSPTKVVESSRSRSRGRRGRRGRRGKSKDSSGTDAQSTETQKAEGKDSESKGEENSDAKPAPKKRSSRGRRKSAAKTDEKAAAKDEPKAEPKSEPATKKRATHTRKKPEPKADDKSATKAEAKADKPATKKRATRTRKKAEPKTEEKSEPKAESDDKPATEAKAADKPAPKRKRTPKKRGGKLPKRAKDDNTPSGGDGTEGIPGVGPLVRYMRGGGPRIQDVLKRGQEVVVQVTKASQGGKGPGVSSMISLPGRYMVLTPNSNRGGVSRKIENQKARNTLKKMLAKLPVPEGMGVIIRTAAVDRTLEDLRRDLNYLLRVWSVVVERIHSSKAPAILYSDSDPAIRTVRDYFTAETDEIIIDNKEVFDRVVGFFEQLMPKFKNRVKLYESDVPLFFNEGLEPQIDRIFAKKVNLKSGGYLFIEQTEALVSIDVNSGKFTSAGDAEKTAYLTNLEAVPEICRQLRLRDLGGIVCNDLIDMSSAKHRADIERKLRNELRRDRARTKVARISPFGVIEMTRQRVRPSIKNYNYVTCPTCKGFGMVRSAETMCLSLIRMMKLALIEDRVSQLVVQIHPHVLSHLHSEFRNEMDQIEEDTGKSVLFEYARDVVLGSYRFFYVNDRGGRVFYDMDQRINQFAPSKSQSVAKGTPVPQATTTAVTTDPEKKSSKKRRRRRGGRKQREREEARRAREDRIKDEASKAVSLGDKLPDIKPEIVKESELKKEKAEAKAKVQKVKDKPETRKDAKKETKAEASKKPARKTAPKKSGGKVTATPVKSDDKPEVEPKKPTRRKTAAKKKSDEPESKSTAKGGTRKSVAKSEESKPAAKKRVTATRKKAADDKKSATKPTTKKAATKKPATKKATATKKPAAKTKTVAKKPAAKKKESKPATKRTSTAKKPATKAAKAAPKKTAAKKPAAKKTATRKKSAATKSE